MYEGHPKNKLQNGLISISFSNRKNRKYTYLYKFSLNLVNSITVAYFSLAYINHVNVNICLIC